MTLKYLIDADNNIQIFSPTIIHSHAARTMPSRIMGAGFVSFNPTIIDEEIVVNITCSGESVSLNIPSRNEIDTEIIRNKLGLKTKSNEEM